MQNKRRKNNIYLIDFFYRPKQNVWTKSSHRKSFMENVNILQKLFSFFIIQYLKNDFP